MQGHKNGTLKKGKIKNIVYSVAPDITIEKVAFLVPSLKSRIFIKFVLVLRALKVMTLHKRHLALFRKSTI